MRDGISVWIPSRSLAVRDCGSSLVSGGGEALVELEETELTSPPAGPVALPLAIGFLKQSHGCGRENQAESDHSDVSTQYHCASHGPKRKEEDDN
jgi:hypothetical protein